MSIRRLVPPAPEKVCAYKLVQSSTLEFDSTVIGEQV